MLTIVMPAPQDACFSPARLIDASAISAGPRAAELSALMGHRAYFELLSPFCARDDFITFLRRLAQRQAIFAALNTIFTRYARHIPSYFPHKMA